jgi:hypothetical protein
MKGVQRNPQGDVVFSIDDVILEKVRPIHPPTKSIRMVIRPQNLVEATVIKSLRRHNEDKKLQAQKEVVCLITTDFTRRTLKQEFPHQLLIVRR